MFEGIKSRNKQSCFHFILNLFFFFESFHFTKLVILLNILQLKTKTLAFEMDAIRLTSIAVFRFLDGVMKI